MGSRYRHESINQDFVHVVSCPSLASLEKPRSRGNLPQLWTQGRGRQKCMSVGSNIDQDVAQRPGWIWYDFRLGRESVLKASSAAKCGVRKVYNCFLMIDDLKVISILDSLQVKSHVGMPRLE